MPNKAERPRRDNAARPRAASAAFAAAGLAIVGLLVVSAWPDGASSGRAAATAPASAIPIAVLGDSGSQSYADNEWFPPEKGERGGSLRSRTFQWAEVLARLRGDELDLGPWMQWGRPGVIAQGRELLGMTAGRAPAKQDFLHNFANSGASCNDLMRGRFRQAPRLVVLMNKAPERWQRGVVVLRIGLNDWSSSLDLQAHDPNAAELRESLDLCKQEISAAIALIHASHPSTRILVVGIGNEADDPANLQRYQSAVETQNLRAALARFNGMLRGLTTNDPRLSYFDDAAWFEARWGSRSPDGKPSFKAVEIGSTLRVTNTAGDEPHNALLNDHHAGVAWNTLWAQSLVEHLDAAWGLRITPITDSEVERFLARLLSPSGVENAPRN
ncbi:conserved hypothetical protein [Burkholderiales bacterium 8X]|nr:conserved hypothetical protein [Burkholderiales bacterium 8X]